MNPPLGLKLFKLEVLDLITTLISSLTKVEVLATAGSALRSELKMESFLWNPTTILRWVHHLGRLALLAMALPLEDSISIPWKAAEDETRSKHQM